MLYSSLHKNWTLRTLALWAPEIYPTSQLLPMHRCFTGNKRLFLLPTAQEQMTLSLPPLLSSPREPRC